MGDTSLRGPPHTPSHTKKIFIKNYSSDDSYTANNEATESNENNKIKMNEKILLIMMISFCILTVFFNIIQYIIRSNSNMTKLGENSVMNKDVKIFSFWSKISLDRQRFCSPSQFE